MKDILINIFDKIININRLIIELLCGTTLIAMVIFISIGVFFRYVLRSSLPWIPELTRFMLVAISMFGAVLAVDRNEHVSVSIVYEKLPAKIKMILDIIRILLFGYLAYLFIIAGIPHAQAGGGAQFTGIPLFYPRMIIPVSGVMIIVFLLNELKRTFDKEHKRKSEAEEVLEELQ